MGQSRADEGDFFALLAALREFRARALEGDPSDRSLARAAQVSPTTIGKWLSGSQFPHDVDRFLPVVRAIAFRSVARGVANADRAMNAPLDDRAWRGAYRREAARRAETMAEAVEGAQAARALTLPTAGRSLTEMSDPFALEVHRPVQPEGSGSELPALPFYVRRDHDGQLAEVVLAAAGGSSGIAVLVGGSSTGKTRACWEALGLLRDQTAPWRLWHPIDPSRPEAALRELPLIGPQTVVWLNEAQFYLEAPGDGVGERVAAGLRELLRDPDRAPVLVLATLWPQFWDALTARPPAGETDPHAQARELLSGWDISVPGAFTGMQMQRITGSEDPRLALAAVSAQDGQVVQFLAGAPELLARYDYAPPTAKALISAAIDARRLGMGVGLPLGFLAAAAPGYLTESEWDGLRDDWLEQALAYTAADCKGTRGPLTRIRPRPSSAASAVSEPAYRLADYLDQHGRRSRRSAVPPAEFWTAALDLSDPGDLSVLARAAEGRGLLHDSALLRRAAITHGGVSASPSLFNGRRTPGYGGEDRPKRVVGHAALDDSYDIARLLDALRRAGATEQVTALLARDPATHAPLDDSYAIARLLYALRAADANAQVAILLARNPAAHAPLDNAYAVARLLDALQAAGAAAQVAILLARDPAGHAPLDNPYAVARLLDALRAVGATEQTAVFLARDPAAHAPLDNSYAIAWLLDTLRKAGATEQITALLARDPAAHASVDNAWVAWLVNALRAVGAVDQAEVVVARAAAHAPLDNPDAVAWLLNALRASGTTEQIAAFLARDPAARVPLDHPTAVAQLLYALQRVGATDQTAALLARDPATHVPLDHPDAVAQLLHAFLKVGATDQTAALLARNPASHVPVDHPTAVARLLDTLRKAGAAEQVATLVGRGPAAHAALDNSMAVSQLLHALRAAGATDQAEILASRTRVRLRVRGEGRRNAHA
jgi:uncharacterized protein YidB (DUF937 family)